MPISKIFYKENLFHKRVLLSSSGLYIFPRSFQPLHDLSIQLINRHKFYTLTEIDVTYSHLHLLLSQQILQSSLFYIAVSFCQQFRLKGIVIQMKYCLILMLLWNFSKIMLPNLKHYQEQISDFVHLISLLYICQHIKKMRSDSLLYMGIAKLS